MEEFNIHPTVIIGLGRMGSESISMIIQRIEDKIGDIPWIFGFVNIDLLSQNDMVEVSAHIGNSKVLKNTIPKNLILKNPSELLRLLSQVYDGVVSVRNINLTKKQPFQVDQSSLETYLVSSLCDSLGSNLLIELAQKIGEKISRGMVFGPRRGIFILSEMFVEGDLAELEAKTLKMLEKLNQAMSSDYPPFENCYFIDRLNEKGLTIGQEVDVTNLISEFLIYTTLSPLAKKIRSVIKPYVGSSPLEEAYCSFGFVSFCYNSKKAIDFNAAYLEQEILRSIIEKPKEEIIPVSMAGSEEKSRNESSYKWILDFLGEDKIETSDQDSSKIETKGIFTNLKEEVTSKIESLFLEKGGNLPSVINLLRKVSLEGSQAWGSLVEKIRLLKREIVRLKVRLMFEEREPYEKPPLRWPLIAIAGGLISGAIVALFILPIISIFLIVPGIILLIMAFHREPRIVEWIHPSEPLLDEELRRKKRRLNYLEKIKLISQNFAEYLDRSLIGSEMLQKAIANQSREVSRDAGENDKSISSSPFIQDVLDEDNIKHLFSQDGSRVRKTIDRFFQEFGIVKFLLEPPNKYISTLQNFCKKEFVGLHNKDFENILIEKLSLDKSKEVDLQLEDFLRNLIDDSVTLCQVDPYKTGSSSIIVGIESSASSSIKKYFQRAHQDIIFVSAADNESIVVLQLRRGLPIEFFISPRQRGGKK